jgi:hypothetical protein
MNRRFVPIVAACLVSALTSASTSAQQPKPDAAQAKPAAAPAAAPAAPAKWVPPIKGEGTVDFVRGTPQRVKGGEVQTKFKVKNTSKGALALLSVEEIWYNAKGAITQNGIYRHRQLLNPGVTIEFVISVRDTGDLNASNLMFKHANGTVKPNKVSKL